MALRNISPARVGLFIRLFWPLGAAIGGLALAAGIARSLSERSRVESVRRSLAGLHARDVSATFGAPAGYVYALGPQPAPDSAGNALDIARRIVQAGRVPVIWSDLAVMYSATPDAAEELHGEPVATGGATYAALPGNI